MIVVDLSPTTREAARREWSLPKPPIWLMTPAVLRARQVCVIKAPAPWSTFDETDSRKTRFVGGHVAPTYRSPPNKRPFVVEVIRSRKERKRPSLKGSREAVSSNSEPGTLVLVRHGESEFNRQDRFTGLKNPPLTSTGVQEAVAAGRTLHARGFSCDVAFTSKLKRAQQSLALILKELHATAIPIFEDAALNERDYGVLAGMTREAASRRWGDARIQLWRRSYDVAPPDGESLAMTAKRTLPFLERSILPLLGIGRRVLVVAHGNSLRSIVMALDQRSPEEIVKISFATGTMLIYRLFDLDRIVERVEIPPSD